MLWLKRMGSARYSSQGIENLQPLFRSVIHLTVVVAGGGIDVEESPSFKEWFLCFTQFDVLQIAR